MLVVLLTHLNIRAEAACADDDALVGMRDERCAVRGFTLHADHAVSIFDQLASAMLKDDLATEGFISLGLREYEARAS